jgi:UDP-glucose 6-dehydrogenase
LTYDNVGANINAKIENECNIVEYVSKSTETNNKTRFLFHPNLYNSTCNYRNPHNLILNASIKAHLGNLGGKTFLILGVSIKARLDNLNDATFDRLNHLGMLICH